MATYTIVTNREQEIGLDYVHAQQGADGQTQAQFLQERVSHQVLNPMWETYQYDHSVSLEKSIATIPPENEAQAAAEIEAVIVANGGTLVPPGTPTPPVPPPPSA